MFANGPAFGTFGYNVAKAAQEAVVKNLALHFAHHGARVNAVRYGAIVTPIFDIFGPGRSEYVLSLPACQFGPVKTQKDNSAFVLLV